MYTNYFINSLASVNKFVSTLPIGILGAEKLYYLFGTLRKLNSGKSGIAS